MRYPDYFTKLIETFKQLPSVGTRTAERFAFSLLDWPEKQLSDTIDNIEYFKKNLTSSEQCGSLIDHNGCPYCKRDSSTLCIIANPKDVFTIEATHEYYGIYHVLGGVISPMEGYTSAHLSIEKLKQRVQQLSIKEIIIALDSTVEGDATALHLRKELSQYNIKISRPAFGLPMGSPFEYVDSGTLAQAIHGRQSF